MWDDEQGDGDGDNARPVAKDYFGHDLPWRLGTCAGTHHTTRTQDLWPVCHDKKAGKRVVQQREAELVCNEILKRQLADNKSLLDIIGKPVQNKKPQRQHQGRNLKEAAIQGSIVFIKTHKTATEYDFVVCTIDGGYVAGSTSCSRRLCSQVSDEIEVMLNRLLQSCQEIARSVLCRYIRNFLEDIAVLSGSQRVYLDTHACRLVLC